MYGPKVPRKLDKEVWQTLVTKGDAVAQEEAEKILQELKAPVEGDVLEQLPIERKG